MDFPLQHFNFHEHPEHGSLWMATYTEAGNHLGKCPALRRVQQVLTRGSLWLVWSSERLEAAAK